MLVHSWKKRLTAAVLLVANLNYVLWLSNNSTHAVAEFDGFLGGFYRNGASHKTSLSTGVVSEQQEKELKSNGRCALCFFGLPRSYKSLVLPSIEKNILRPNAKYGCDVFVHYYFVYEEDTKTQNNRGGKIDPNEVLLLQQAIHDLSSSTVHFTNDTEAEFMQKRKIEYDRYHNTYDNKGRLTYHPWKSKFWKPVHFTNVLRQWHSIDAAFQLMEDYGQQHHINYTRVAMLRNDALYATPIDIMSLDNMETLDIDNSHFVMPPFSRDPANDRMVYGPYDAVKVWATKRFELIEERVKDPKAAGWVMQSERFMAQSIIPAMAKLGFTQHTNPDTCFFRTRADSVAIVSDCHYEGETRGMPRDPRKLKRKVEKIVNRTCKLDNEYAQKGMIKYVTCQ